MKSPWLPISGMVLVWVFYACFIAVLSPAPPAHHAEPTVLLSPNRMAKVNREPPETLPPPSVPMASEPGEATGDKPQGEAPEKPAPKPKPALRLTPEDEELMAILSAPFEQEDLDRLEVFVAEHPDHVLARAALVMRLLRADGTDPAIRSHVAELQALMPDYALPDLFMARLELLAGREDVARNVLLDAAEKDMTWLPDTELFRMKIASELAAGTPPSQILANAFGMDVSFCVVARDTLRPFISPPKGDGGSEALDPRVRVEAARAVLRFGEAMQEHGAIMIDSLVGSALVKGSIEVIRQSRALTEREQLLLQRTESIRREATLVGGMFPEVLFSEPGLMGRFLENMVAHGELRAGRRALMDYLAAQIRRRR